MKNFTNNFKQFTSRLSARWLIMALMMLVGTSSALGAQYNLHWKGKVYFLVPEKWDLSTYSTVQVDITRTTSATTSNHQEYIGKMTRIGTSRLFYIQIDANHSYWNQNEYIAFTANSYAYNSGSFNLNGNKLYTTPLDYGCNNSNNYYLFKPSTESQFTTTTNGNTLTASYNSARDNVLKANQTVYIYTNGSSSTSGGSVSLTGYYLSSDDAMKQSTVNSSSTSAEYEAAPGSEMNLTAVAKSGYEFEGWYTDASGGTLLSSNTSYTYNVYQAKKIYARFKQSCVTVEEPDITYNSSICLGSELILTLNKRQEGVTYKIDGQDQEIFTEGNNTYSFAPQTSGTGSLTVVASHTNACSGTSYPKEIQYTVNTLPSVPILTTGSTNVCPGTVTLANFKAMAEQNTVVWYSNQECTKEVTTPTVEKGGRYTFYAKSKNASGCFSEGYSTLEVNVYDDPKDFTLTAFPTEICSGADVEISISNKQDGVTYKLGEEIIDEIITVNPTDDTEYTVTAYLNACPTLIRSKSTGVITVHPIPSFTVDPTNLSLCKGSTSVTDLTELSHVVIENGDPVWYDAETAGNVVTTGADLENGGTYWVAAENNETGCVNTKRKSFTLKIYDLPKYPDLTKTSAVVCQADETVNLNTLAGVNDVIWYQGEDEVQKPDEISIDEEGIFTYTAKAVNANGCQSATGVDFKLTVNSLPTITSISASNDKPVLFEDVVLTADGVTSGAEVKWYLGNDVTPDATGTTYTVTSETAGEVIVKAKAFLNGCESAVASHTVKFSEEDCTPDASDDIQITFIHPNDKGKNCQYWGLGTLTYYIGSTKKTHNFGNSTTAGAEGNLTISNLTVDKITKVRLDAAYDYGKCTAYATIMDLEKGYHYTLTLSDAQQTSEKAQKSVTLSKVSLTTDPPITAPAVKMVSAEYDEVNDKIVAKGAVYKTGCGTTFWGFQYSTDGQTWGTAETDYIRPNSGNSLTKAGEFEYSFAIPNAGGGDIYYIRAYALNNYNGSYALSNAVYSATSLPVEIPSSTIESATILLVNSEGNESTDSEVCPQSTVYLKVFYVGGDFTDFIAEENFPGTDLELVNHDKVKNYAIFSFTATADGTANITISNNSGSTVTPADGVSITLKDVQVATPPTIYLEKNTICDNQTTNVVVNSPIVGLSYSLKNGSVGDPVTYESGDLKFPVSKEGSYTVQVQETVCGTTAISAPVDLRVITSDVKITLTTDVNTITPWQPLTLTVKAPSGYDYDLQGLDGTVYTKSGDVYTIKFPRPDSWRVGNSESNSEPKTFTAGIKAGEEPSCSTTTKEIQLVDTEEECLAVGN